MPFLDRSSVKVWWDTVGRGTPLLLIQGLGYQSDASWRILPALRARHTIILLDNRGVGRSDVPEGTFTISDLAGDAAAAIEAAGRGPAHVAGFSMGGLIAEQLTIDRPDLVRTLTLGCTSPGGSVAIPFTREVAEQFTDWGDLPPREAALRAAGVCYARSTAPEAIAADIRVRMKRPTDRRGYLHQMRAVAQYSGAAARLSRVQKPALIVHGSADLIVPVENADILAELLPRSLTVVFAGAGHIVMTDAGDRLTEAMLEFTVAHDQASGAA